MLSQQHESPSVNPDDDDDKDDIDVHISKKIKPPNLTNSRFRNLY